MAIVLQFKPDRAYLHAVIEGPVTAADIGAALDSIVSSTEYPPNVPVLWDFTAAALQTWGPDTPRRIAELRRRYPQRGPGRVALLAASDLTFGLLRMHQAYLNGWQVEEGIFRTLAEAEAWLVGPDLLGGDPDATNDRDRRGR